MSCKVAGLGKLCILQSQTVVYCILTLFTGASPPPKHVSSQRKIMKEGHIHKLTGLGLHPVTTIFLADQNLEHI